MRSEVGGIDILFLQDDVQLHHPAGDTKKVGGTVEVKLKICCCACKVSYTPVT
jgi:hypothetical protein